MLLVLFFLMANIYLKKELYDAIIQRREDVGDFVERAVKNELHKESGK